MASQTTAEQIPATTGAHDQIPETLALALPVRAADVTRPSIKVIPKDAPLKESGVYPAEMRVSTSDGKYTKATIDKSAGNVGGQVAFWASEAGVLKTDSYPMDEFVHVLEGALVTTDADGTRHEFRAGDMFILPKGWAGTWDMKSRFKKIIVNY